MIKLNNFLKNAALTLLFLAFSHNSFGMNVLASGSKDKTIKIWQQKYGQFKHIQTLDHESRGHTGWVISIACNKDGLLASGSHDKTIKIWQPNTNGTFEHIQTIDQNSGGHTGWVMSIAFNKEGLLVSGSRDRTIKIWKPNKNWKQNQKKPFEHIQTIDYDSSWGHIGPVKSIAFNKDGLLASGSHDRTIKIWKPNTDGKFEHIQTIDYDSSWGHTGWVMSIAFNKDGLLASGSWDNTIKIWKSNKNWKQNQKKPFEHIQTLDQTSGGHTDYITLIAFNKDGLLVSASFDKTIKIWKSNPNKNNQFEHIQTIDQNSGGHKGAVKSVTCNKDGLLVSGSYDNIIKIWKPTKDWKQNNEKPFECIQTIDQNSGGHTSAVRGIVSMLLGPNKFNQELKNNINYRNIKIITEE